MSETRFRPGRELSRAFYVEAVRPLIDDVLPGLRHSACLFGPGSEVLGHDTERSTDHDWGPRLQLLVESPDETIQTALSERLPHRFAGFPTRGVDVQEPAGFFVELLGFDPNAGVTLEDWLLTPSQLLLSITAGAVFEDGLEVLRRAQGALDWYPTDVWLYLLSCQWRRIAQEEHFVGRTGEVGDDLGSRLLAGRLVRDLLRLCFLQERRHAPYIKWLGTAFQSLRAARAVGGALAEVLSAASWKARDAALAHCYETVAGRHNQLRLTAPVDPTPHRFHERPYQVLFADRFATACREAISDPRVRGLGWLGSIDQFADSTDLLSNPRLIRSAGLFGLPVRPPPHPPCKGEGIH